MNKSNKKFVVGILIAVLWILLYSLRIINLDADMPNYGIAFYQQIDEGSYSYLALNQLNYGCINPDISVDEVEQYTAPHLRTNLVGNLLTFAGVKIFGDTYYGFRLGSIICMFCNYVLIYLILAKLRKWYGTSENKSWRLLILFVLLLTFDFSFTLASRIVETSIYRMLFLLLVVVGNMYLERDNFLKYFFIGFLAVFSVFGIYITNIFLVVACGFQLIYMFVTENKKHVLKCVAGFCMGGILALIICELYMQTFWNVSLVQNSIEIISSFSNIGGYVETGGNSRVNYLLNFLGANFNLYNPAISMLTLCALPITATYAFKKKEKNIIFLISIYLCMLAQTIFSEDYIIRKYIIVAPVVVAIIYYYILHFKDIVGSWTKKKKTIFSAYAVIAMFITIGESLHRLKFIKDGSELDFSRWDKRIIYGISIITCVLLLYYILSYIWNQRAFYKRRDFCDVVSYNIGCNVRNKSIWIL